MNIKNLECLEKLLDNHLCGGHFEYSRHYITFYFIDKYQGLGGVRSAIEGSKSEAIRKLIIKLDELYNHEFSWATDYVPLNSLESN